jgi:hypothetical protein
MVLLCGTDIYEYIHMGDTVLLDTLEVVRKSGNKIPEQVWETVENAILGAFLPRMTVANERPCEESDFKEYLLNIGSRLKALTLIFQQIAKNLGCDEFNTNKRISKNHAVYLLILCGEHSIHDKWTTKETIKYSEELLSLLCKLWCCKSISLMLIGNESRQEYFGLFSAALLSLRPKLQKNTWKTYPAAVSCYQWLLFQVKVTKGFVCICMHSDFHVQSIILSK